MYNLEELEALLDKYWLGDTTLEEERTLKAYFATSAVDARFQAVAPLFQTLRQEQTVRLERSKVVALASHRSSVRLRWAVAASVLLALGAWWMFRPVLPTEVAVQQQPALVVPPSAPSPAVAPLTAPTLVAIAQPAPVRKHIRTRKVTQPQIDAETEQAMEEIKAALSLVSSKLNKGKKAALKDLNHLETMDKFLKPKSDS